MDQTRFRIGLTLIALGGVAYLVALGVGAAPPGYAPAPGLVALGLAVHLSDRVMRRSTVTAAGLVLAVASAAADAVLSALDRGGAGSALATVGLVVGVLVAVVARRRA